MENKIIIAVLVVALIAVSGTFYFYYQGYRVQIPENLRVATDAEVDSESDGGAGEIKVKEKKVVEKEKLVEKPFNGWNVVDVYNSLPDKYQELGEFDPDDDFGNPHVVDYDNYFLELVDGEFVTTTTVFLKNGGDAVVAISNVGCGPLCHQELFFLEYKNEKWIGITSKVFEPMEHVDLDTWFLKKFEEQEGRDFDQDNDIKNILYELPQYGTSIVIYDMISDINIAELKWNGKMFNFYWK